MINTINIKNFKMLKDVNFDFKGFKVNLIHGKPYNGKSAVLSAIDLCKHNRTESKISGYVNWAVQKQRGGKFEIEYNEDFKGHNYSQILKSRSTGLDRDLIIDNDDTQSFHNSQAFDELNKIFKIDIVKNAIYSNQRDISKILFTTTGDRLKEFKNIFGFDKIKNLSESLKNDESVEKTKSEKLDTEIKVLKEIVFEYHDEPDVTIDIDEVNFLIEKLEQEKKVYTENLELYNTYVQNTHIYNNAIEQIEMCEKNIKLTDIELSNLKEKDNLNIDLVEYENLKQKKNDLELKKVNVENDFKKYNESISCIKEYNSKIEELTKKFNIIEIYRVLPPECSISDIEQLEKELDTCRQNYLIKKSTYTAVLAGKCDKCNADYSHYTDEEKQKLDTELKELEIKGYDLKQLIKDNKDLWESYNASVTQNKNNLDKKNDIQDNINYFTKKLEEYSGISEPNDSIDNISNESNLITDKIINIENLIKEQKVIDTANETVRIRVVRLQSIKTSLESQVSDYGLIEKPDDMEMPNFNFDEYENTKNKIGEYEHQIKQKEQIEEINKGIKEQKNKNLKNIELKENELVKVKREISILNSSRHMLDKEYSTYLINNGSFFIKEEMNRFFQLIHGDYEVSYENDANGITFCYQDKEHKIPTEFNLASGFEADLLSTAFRIALCKITGSEILILDEIDKYADSNLAVNLYDAILNESHIKQIFCITHNENVKEMLMNKDDCQDFEIKNGLITNSY